MSRVEQMKKIQAQGLELFRRKNADYGDAFAEFGFVGVLVRLEDKMKRAMNICSTEITLVNEESLRDTLLDMHNYSAMALMLLDESNENDEKEEEKDKPHQKEEEEEPQDKPIISTEIEETDSRCFYSRFFEYWYG